MAKRVIIEKKLYGMERQNRSVAPFFSVAEMVPITKIPHRERGRNELSTVGSML